MSKNNENFFVEKKPWSVIKDNLLAEYLKPYLSKILYTGKPFVYIDGFAGKGLFDDGEKGSPIIACEQICGALARSNIDNPQVDAFFIEKQYTKELADNLKRFDFAEVKNGSYENELPLLIEQHKETGKNVLLYVDPFGVKYLNSGMFLNVEESFNSAEVILNFNSFGFFRAACRLYKIEFDDVDFNDEFEERVPWDYQEESPDASKLSTIVGGDFWKPIVQDYKEKMIDGYEAEKMLAKYYQQYLSSIFKYVLNIPVKRKEHHHPKYRLFHMSNHRDGCLLMYENMYKWSTEQQIIMRSGQSSLFSTNSESELVDTNAILQKFENHIMAYQEYTLLEDVLASFLTNIELSISLKELTNKVFELEKNGAVSVQRKPETTKLNRPTRFKRSNLSKNQEVRIRWNHA